MKNEFEYTFTHRRRLVPRAAAFIAFVHHPANMVAFAIAVFADCLKDR